MAVLVLSAVVLFLIVAWRQGWLDGLLKDLEKLDLAKLLGGGLTPPGAPGTPPAPAAPGAVPTAALPTPDRTENAALELAGLVEDVARGSDTFVGRCMAAIVEMGGQVHKRYGDLSNISPAAKAGIAAELRQEARRRYDMDMGSAAGITLTAIYLETSGLDTAEAQAVASTAVALLDAAADAPGDLAGFRATAVAAVPATAEPVPAEPAPAEPAAG